MVVGAVGAVGAGVATAVAGAADPVPGTAASGVAAPEAFAALSADELAANTKAAHVVRVLDASRPSRHLARHAKLMTGPAASAHRRAVKVLVFSQFRSVLNLVGDILLRRYGVEAVAEFWGKHRIPELQKFAQSELCFVMLLGKDGAVGLDLSFVTHIFLMDQIWDRSLEMQVVARAHRMGAKGAVLVEQLVMGGTVEEKMSDMAVNSHSAQSDTEGKPEAPQEAPNVAGQEQAGQGSSEAADASGAASPPHTRRPKKAKARGKPAKEECAKLHCLLRSATLVKQQAPPAAAPSPGAAEDVARCIGSSASVDQVSLAPGSSISACAGSTVAVFEASSANPTAATQQHPFHEQTALSSQLASSSGGAHSVQDVAAGPRACQSDQKHLSANQPTKALNTKRVRFLD